MKEDSFLEVGAFVFFEGLNACFFVMNELISCRVDGMWGLVEPNAADVTSHAMVVGVDWYGMGFS